MSASQPKKQITLLIPAISWGFLILYLTLRPKSDSSSIQLPDFLLFLPIDKLAHFLFWGIWYVLFHVSYLNKWHGFHHTGHIHMFSLRSRHQVYGAIAMVIIGGLIELMQHQLQWGREAEWLDLLADTTGVAAAMLSLSFFIRTEAESRSK